MPMQTIPDRASDSGADVQEQPLNWRDHLDFAGSEITRAERLADDDIERQRLQRKAAIRGAIEYLERALEVLR